MQQDIRYPRTTAPINLGPVEIRNRFYLAPHGVGYNVGYEPSDVFAAYYGARARGGCGLLVYVMSTMPKRAGGSVTTPYLERTIPSFKAVADGVHAPHGQSCSHRSTTRGSGTSGATSPAARTRRCSAHRRCRRPTTST